MIPSGSFLRKLFLVSFFFFISNTLISQTLSDSNTFERNTFLKTEDANVFENTQLDLKLFQLHDISRRGFTNFSELNVKLGLSDRFQIGGGFSLVSGSYDGKFVIEGVNDIGINLQYKFFNESENFPASSIELGARQYVVTPQGKNSTFAKLLLSKSIGSTRFHFNLKYETNPDFENDYNQYLVINPDGTLEITSRKNKLDRFSYGLGFEIPLNNKIRFLSEVYRESESLYLINAGLNLKLSKVLGLNLGLGSQIGSSRFSNFMFSAGIVF